MFKIIKSRSIASIAASTVLSIFAGVLIAQAATVISTDILTAGNIETTAGTLTIAGASTLTGNTGITGNLAVTGTTGLTGLATIAKATTTLETVSNLYIGTGTNTSPITWQRNGSAAMDFAFVGVLASGKSGCVAGSADITVTGAAAGDTVFLGVPNSYASTTADTSYTFQGWVSATNTVKIKACAIATTTVQDLTGGTIKASVWH